MNVTKITPSTKPLNELANGMQKYLSEVSHEYLNRAAILPEIKVRIFHLILILILQLQSYPENKALKPVRLSILCSN